jgi:hypothetical protein
MTRHPDTARSRLVRDRTKGDGLTRKRDVWGTVQESATRALKGGATLDSVLEMVSRVAPELKAPMVLFTYFNPLLCRGFEKVIKQIAEAGVKGTSVKGPTTLSLKCFSHTREK